MTILRFFPEAVFVNLISDLINNFKEKFAKKAKVKVEIKSRRRKDSDK